MHEEFLRPDVVVIRLPSPCDQPPRNDFVAVSGSPFTIAVLIHSSYLSNAAGIHCDSAFLSQPEATGGVAVMQATPRGSTPGTADRQI
jgi:hypothetical protein